jgi:hypothetical protein
LKAKYGKVLNSGIGSDLINYSARGHNPNISRGALPVVEQSPAVQDGSAGAASISVMSNMDGEVRLKVKSPHKRSKTLFAEEAEGR